MFEMLVYGGMIILIWMIGVQVVQRFEHPAWHLSKRQWWMLLLGSSVNALLIVELRSEWIEGIALAVLAGSLLFACITDCMTYEVYHFIWWIAGGVGMLMILGSMAGIHVAQVDMVEGLEFLFFGILQEVAFARIYGKADCHAFVVCAMAECWMGMGLLGYLMHMAIGFGILTVVQAFKRNINRKGNLKQPVAFLPYITLSFWINCGCFSWEKMIY